MLIASKRKRIAIGDVLARDNIERPRGLAWAIVDLEEEESITELTKPTALSKQNKKRIDYLFDSGVFDLPDSLRPNCHRNGHTYKSMYGRLRYDEPAQTIATGYGSPGQGKYVHPTRLRTLTPHEAARIQCFPDYFDFTDEVTRTGLASMIGNAVPMKLAYVFVMEFLVG